MGSTSMSSTHERNDQINVVVTEEKKARCKQHLDQNGAEFQSLSHHIRQAVEKEVSDTEADTSNASVPARDNSGFLETIGRLDEKL